MNQYHRPAGAFDYEVQARAVNLDEFRLSLSIDMSNARRDVGLLESAGNPHRNNLSCKEAIHHKDTGGRQTCTDRTIRFDSERNLIGGNLIPGRFDLNSESRCYEHSAPNRAAQLPACQFEGCLLFTTLDEGARVLVTFSRAMRST